MSHFKKMKLVPFNVPPVVQQPDIGPFINPAESSLKNNILEKNDILSSDIQPTKKNIKLNKNLQSFKVLTKNILNQTENSKKPIKLKVEKSKIKPENFSVKNIKLEEQIIPDIKPSQRKSKRIKNKSTRLRAAAPYKKSFSPPKIAWEFT